MSAQPPDPSAPAPGDQTGEGAQAAARLVQRLHARRRLGVGAAVVLVIAAFAVTVVIGMLRTTGAPAQAVRVSVEVSASPSTQAVYVHVSGAVRTPGLYVLEPDARAMDAVAAAGGFTAKADRDGVNLARPLADGEQLVIPVRGAPPTAPPAASESQGGQGGQGGAAGQGSASGRVNLNTADEAALEGLPGIGPALAGRILQWREKNGKYTSVEDLLAVPGIGPEVLSSLRDLVTV